MLISLSLRQEAVRTPNPASAVLPGWLSGHQLRQSLSPGRMCCKLREPLQAGFLFLGTDDPPAYGFAIRRRLPAKETPSGLVLFQQPLVWFHQFGSALFV
jgi:hypothetical protein